MALRRGSRPGSPRLSLTALAFAAAGVLAAACGAPLLPATLPVSHSSTAITMPASRAALAPPALEEALLARVNADREAHGLPPVIYDPALQEIARARAAAQVQAPALSHDDDAGPLAFTRLMRRSGVPYHLAGENLARQHPTAGATPSEVAAQAERALMASPTHRENILTPSFDRMAVGAVHGANGQVVFTQLFRAS